MILRSLGAGRGARRQPQHPLAFGPRLPGLDPRHPLDGRPHPAAPPAPWVRRDRREPVRSRRLSPRDPGWVAGRREIRSAGFRVKSGVTKRGVKREVRSFEVRSSAQGRQGRGVSPTRAPRPAPRAKSATRDPGRPDRPRISSNARPGPSGSGFFIAE